MTDPPQFEPRAVRSADPSLSDRANRLLTRELREIVGTDEVEVPVGRPDPAAVVHGVHGPFMATIISARLGGGFMLLAAVCIAAIITLTWNTTAALIAAVAVLLAATIVFLWLLLGLTAEAEHPDPETSALLEAEGVGDPDRLLEDLVEEFREPGRR